MQPDSVNRWYFKQNSQFEISKGYVIELQSRDVIRRLCNKDKDQLPKRIGVIGKDHVVTIQYICCEDTGVLVLNKQTTFSKQ